jgi:exopolyphosphatase/pppGpp-phosphohydrolase
MDVTVLDLGSNSFQLLQARCSANGEVEALFRRAEYMEGGVLCSG